MGVEERVEFGTAKQMITADEDFKEPHQVHNQLLRVELACGQQKQEGYIGVDRENIEGVDIVHDLEQYPWPFEDDSVYEFFTSHYVEHIPIIRTYDSEYGLVKFMEEVWRCLMPGGLIKIVAPYYTSIRAWQDPTHTRAITDITFHYFCREFQDMTKVGHYLGKCNFELISRTYVLNKEWEPRGDEARAWATKHYWNVVDDIIFVFRKKEL